jgi:hypothetical protein
MSWKAVFENPKTCIRRRYYLFFYEPRMSSPKSAEGPFIQKCEAETFRDEEIRKYGKPSRGHRYTIKNLSDAEFEKVWGAPPPS